MNLSENINKIRKIMGFNDYLVEQDSKDLILKTINKHGLKVALELFGGYDKIKDKLTREDKINFIKESVLKKMGDEYEYVSSWNFTESLGIIISRNDITKSTIVYFYPHYVKVDEETNYNEYARCFTLRYDELSDGVLDEIIGLMV